MTLNKKEFLKEIVRHADITKIDATDIIDAMRDMSFSSRDTAAAADILQRMINDDACTNWLILAGSTSAGGCMQVYTDMVRFNMIDCVVATGASVIDMDFFEALGYHHYKGSPFVDDKQLRQRYIDRIYDTFIDEEELQQCDSIIKTIATPWTPAPTRPANFSAKQAAGSPNTP